MCVPNATYSWMLEYDAQVEEERRNYAKKNWAPQASQQQLETSKNLRERYASDPSSLGPEETARVQVLLQRSARKLAKKARRQHWKEAACSRR